MDSIPQQLKPWEDSHLSKQQMFWVRLGATLAFVVGFGSGFLAVFWALMEQALAAPNYTVAVIAFVVMLVSFFGLWKLSPLVSKVPDFPTSYGAVPVSTRRYQYEVMFQNDVRKRSFYGRGVVRFADEGLVIFGSLGLPIWMLAGFLAFVALIVWLVVNLMLSVGIGFLVVVLVSGLGRLWYIKRTTRAFTYSYSDVTSIRMQRRVVTLELNGMPKVVNFVLSKTDGERFYREYVERLPIVSLSASSVR